MLNKKKKTILFILVILGVFSGLNASQVRAEHCDLSFRANGYLFDDYYETEYDEDGWLTIHLKQKNRFNDGRSWKLRVISLNDECDSASRNPYNTSVGLPAGTEYFSIRFTARDKFEVWSDDTEELIRTYTIPEKYPEYYEYWFWGRIAGTEFRTELHNPNKNHGGPPLKDFDLEPHEQCIDKAADGHGYLFDSYEHAEYDEGLIRWYLRLKSPFNDGRVWHSGLVFYDENCERIDETRSDVTIRPYSRYYSVNLTSSTTYEIWNDELNAREACGGCSEDFSNQIPEGAKYVSFYGSVISGSSKITTTPFPILESDYLSSLGGNSNVAFIPGLQASRLYTKEGGSENRLWEPNTDADGVKLRMTESGESLNDIYTKGVVGEGFGVVNVYKSFIEMMGDMEDEGEIVDWSLLPYDWRQDVFDVAAGDIRLTADGAYRMVEEVERLASSSNTGKVTLITHSNGGLVAKALISELEEQGKGDLIDKLVLVAVPQVGTPQAIASILHGDGQGIGKFGIKFLTKETAREMGRNMPAGYGLLPSSAYFRKVSDPVVVFDEDSSTTAVARGVYETSQISDVSTLDDFMTGSPEGREMPESDDLLSPIVSNDSLLDNARGGQSILDSWSAPEGVDVIEIIGWGLPTLKGVEYKDKEVVRCEGLLVGCEKEVVMDHEPLTTVDGDRTVVSPSADYMTSSGKYYVNLPKNNFLISRNREHGDILEVSSTLSLLDSIIRRENSELPDFITESKPLVSKTEDSLRLSVHSPVSISVKDSEGRLVGIVDDSDLVEIDEEIPNSFYLSFGDGKYIGVPRDGNYEVEIVGEGVGTFDFNIEHISGDSVVEVQSFEDIPVTDDLQANLTIESGELDNLEVDVDGNGSVDVYVEEGQEFSSTSYIALLRSVVENADINKGHKKSLLSRLNSIERSLEKGKPGNSVDALLHSMTQTLKGDRGASHIIEIINILRAII